MSVPSNPDGLVILDMLNADSPPARLPSASAGTCSHTRRQKVLDPATSHQCGSISWDRDHGFNIEWESLKDFQMWHENEQQAHGIELCVSQTRGSRASTKQSALFSGSQLYICMCQGTSGIKKYERRSEWENQESKCIEGGCPCQVRIKVYPHTLTVLRKYTSKHSHLTGKDNLKYVTDPSVMLAHKVGPGLQDLQKRGRRILAERNAKKAKENTWIGRMVAAESLGELDGLIKSHAA